MVTVPKYINKYIVDPTKRENPKRGEDTCLKNLQKMLQITESQSTSTPHQYIKYIIYLEREQEKGERNKERESENRREKEREKQRREKREGAAACPTTHGQARGPRRGPGGARGGTQGGVSQGWCQLPQREGRRGEELGFLKLMVVMSYCGDGDNDVDVGDIVVVERVVVVKMVVVLYSGGDGLGDEFKWERS